MFLVCASVRTHCSLLGVSCTVQAPGSLRVGEPVARPRCACLFDMNTTEVYVAAKNVLLLLSHLLEVESAFQRLSFLLTVHTAKFSVLVTPLRATILEGIAALTEKCFTVAR